MHCSERQTFIWQQADNDAPRDLQDTYVCKREFPAYCILLQSCIRSPYFWQKDLCIDLDILCDLWTWYLDDLDLWSRSLKKVIFYSPVLLQRHNSVSVSCVTVSLDELRGVDLWVTLREFWPKVKLSTIKHLVQFHMPLLDCCLWLFQFYNWNMPMTRWSKAKSQYHLCYAINNDFFYYFSWLRTCIVVLFKANFTFWHDF